MEKGNLNQNSGKPNHCHSTLVQETELSGSCTRALALLQTTVPPMLTETDRKTALSSWEKPLTLNLEPYAKP